MELELKHLDFTNNARVKLSRLPHWEFENVNLQDCKLSFNGSSKEPYLRYKDVAFVMDQITIYKRSLSQLTKEIEHNGEKFVPMDIIRKDYIGEAIGLNTATWSHRVVQKLLEWHFDIHGLIENNLAIEIK